MSKLLTIQGLGPKELELLDAAGWGDVRSLAGADAIKLVKELEKANSMLRIMASSPDQKVVSSWIAKARRLDAGEDLEEEETPQPALPPKRMAGVRPKVADPAPEEVRAPRPKKVVKKTAVPEPVAVPAEAAISQENPADTAVEEVPFDEEAALARVSGPVNFEADAGVLEMLSRAPVAIPIPARMLAEKGIRPSEIAIAPLLNQALGDLDVRVYEPEEAPAEQRKAAIPGAGASKDARPRPAPVVAPQISEAAAPVSRRGIDVARVRTIEEFQGDAPAPRNSSSRAGMEDSRIALLRAPLPTTNGRRKPSSRFYIRGVLHDRPLKVWFGGLFAVLLQIMVPLAILSAPLLILKDEKVNHFEWVPVWIIAFPLCVPLIAILYALVSSGAKCRVCGQRLYVPKNCLKNRKAHKALYFGHIGALAFHVMIFKWFNCTFCGTPIRIKK